MYKKFDQLVLVVYTKYMFLQHPFAPIFNEKSAVLILGTFPSIFSRDLGFYYGHPRNRFWDLLGRLFNEDVPESIAGKKRYLLKHKIALYDAIKSCNINGSSDDSISDISPSYINIILASSSIRCIYTNGTKAYKILEEYRPEVMKRYKVVSLPSTSSANANYDMDKLLSSWSKIKTTINQASKVGGW